jgi:hypothetical protein
MNSKKNKGKPSNSCWKMGELGSGERRIDEVSSMAAWFFAG